VGRGELVPQEHLPGYVHTLVQGSQGIIHLLGSALVGDMRDQMILHRILVEKLGNGKKAARVLKTSARQKSGKKSEKLGKTRQTLKNT
jgi:hypothetical protein